MLYFAFAVACAVAALVVDLGQLLALHDVVTLPSWLGGDMAPELVGLVKVVVLAVLARRVLTLPGLFRASTLLAMALALPLLSDLIAVKPSDAGGYEAASWLTTLATHLVVVVCLWILVAAAWWYTSGELRRAEPSSLRGYGQPLHVSALLIGIAMLVYFFDTPRLLGHLLFDVSLLGLIAACLAPAFVLSSGRRLVLYTVVLTVPAVAYVTPFFIGVGAVFYENREHLATLGSETVDVEMAPTLEGLIDAGLTGYTRRRHTPVFNDIWLFADGRSLAINDTRLFERAAGAEEWKPIRELNFSPAAEYLHFDRSGQRGVLGASYENPLRTTDAGQTWAPVDRHTIFATLRGREFGDNLLDEDSALFLDPQTAQGSFMMGCRFFVTTDFAESWEMITLVDEDGDSKCVATSAFAVDLDLGLARASTLSSDYLLQRAAPNAPWSIYCALDSDFFASAAYCHDEGMLSTEQARFVDLAEREAQLVQRQLDHASVDDLLADATIKNAALEDTLRSNGERSWLSGPGYLLQVNGPNEFVIDYRIPRLQMMVAHDERHALGVADSGLFTTTDGGRVWSRLSEDRDDYLSLVLGVPLSGHAYLRSDRQLLRWSAEGLRSVMALPAEFDLTMARGSPDGSTLILADDNSMLQSADSGQTWRKVEMPRPPETIDEYGDRWLPELVSIDCKLIGNQECAAVFEDGSALSWLLDQPDQPRSLPSVLTKDGYAYGLIALLGEAPTYVYLPSDTSQLHRFASGDEWIHSRLGMVVDADAFHDFSADRQHLALQQAAGPMLILHGSGASYLFDEDIWREQVDSVDRLRLCWNVNGTLALLSNSDSRLAISNNGGEAWQQGLGGSRALGSACGLNGDWLWLLGDGLSVYERLR